MCMAGPDGERRFAPVGKRCELRSRMLCIRRNCRDNGGDLKHVGRCVRWLHCADSWTGRYLKKNDNSCCATLGVQSWPRIRSSSSLWHGPCSALTNVEAGPAAASQQFERKYVHADALVFFSFPAVNVIADMAVVVSTADLARTGCCCEGPSLV